MTPPVPFGQHLRRAGRAENGVPPTYPLGLFHHPLWWLLLVAGGLAYCWRPLQRLRAQWDRCGWLQRGWAVILIPCIRATGDVAKMMGYPVGLSWRWTHWDQEEVHWRRTLDSGQRYG